MSDSDLFDAVARKTGEDSHEIRRRCFMLAGADTYATNRAEQRVTNRAVFRDQPSPRPATASQVRAIRAICSRRKIDLLSLLRERFGLATADEVGIRQARNLIDELNSDEPTNGHSSGHQNGNGASATGGARRSPVLKCCPSPHPSPPTLPTRSPRNSSAGTASRGQPSARSGSVR
jgi:hypothetical protein